MTATSPKRIRKLTAGDPETQSADIVAENIARLKALFPELVTEGEKGASVNVDGIPNSRPVFVACWSRSARRYSNDHMDRETPRGSESP